jgi:hypothetical protein
MSKSKRRRAGGLKPPYNPATDKLTSKQLAGARDQLGLPPLEALDAFEVDQLAPGAPGVGVLRARRVALFTLPDQKEAMIEQKVRELRAKGMLEIKAEDISIQQSSMDRNFLPAEYSAISWFVRVHALVIGTGRPGGTSYGDAPRGTSHNRLPYSRQEGSDRAEYAHVAKGVPEAYLVFLDWVARVVFPEEFWGDRKPPSKIEIADTIVFDANEPKYKRGAVDGYFRAITQAVSNLRDEYDTIQKRNQLLLEELSNHRKKAYCG